MTSRSEAGFTLVELLVVLAIMGLVLGLVAANGLPGRRVALDRTVAELAGGMKKARSEAILTGRPVRLVVDMDGRTWSAGAAPVRALPEDLEVEAAATALEPGGRRAAFTFAPDGSSSGGGLVFRGEGREVSLSLDWLTGRMSIAHGD